MKNKQYSREWKLGVLAMAAAVVLPPQLEAAAPVITVNSPSGGAANVSAGAGLYLDTTVTDDGLPNPPASLTYTWTKVSGPGDVTFESGSSNDTVATFSAAGDYVLQLSAYDGADTTQEQVTVTYGGNSSFTPTAQLYGGATGTHSISGGVYTISNSASSGIDLSSASDGFYSLEQAMVGDFDFSCRVDSATDVPGFSDYERVGIVVRAGTVPAADDISAFMGYDSTAPNWAYWVSRTTVGGFNSRETPIQNVSLPRYVRMTRVGNTITGYLSADGVTWANSRSMSMTGDVRVGLAWSSDNVSSAGTAVFSDVKLEGAASGNYGPNVDAGSDFATATATTTLTGSAADDGLPASPGVVTTTWTKVSGPSTVSFSDASSVTSGVTFGAFGTYVLRLTASDGEITTVDDVSVTYALVAPSNAYAWYKSDVGVTVDGSGKVTNWANQTASAADLSNAVGTPQVMTLSRSGGGTAEILKFDGSSALWSAVGSWGTVAGSRSVVVHARVTAAGDGFLFDGSTGVGLTRAQIRNGSWQAGVQSGGFASADTDTTTVSLNTWQTHTFTYVESGGNTQVTHYIDGSQVGTHSVAMDVGLGGLILSANGSASMNLTTEIAEFIVYDRELTAGDRGSAEIYLESRWSDMIDQPFDVQNSTTVQRSNTVSSSGIHGVAALELTSTGNIAGDAAVTSVTFNLNGTTDPTDITEMRLYSSASSTFDANSATLLATAPAAAGTFSTNVSITASPQYLWVAANLSGNSEMGDVLDAEITEFVLAGSSAGTYVPTVTAPPEFLTVGLTYFERTLFTSGATYNETVTMVSSPTTMTNYAGNVITLNGGATLTNYTHTYRIPAIITAANGTLIAMCDARRDHGADLHAATDIDIAIRRSTDNGQTWSDMELICDLGEGHPASDPSLVLDQVTGEIFCFYNYMDRSQTKEYRLWVQSSTDHGSTWSIPRDITDDITLPEWKFNFKFMTSGRGYQTRSGRLIHNIVRVGSGVHLFASDDHGKTWFLLNETPISPGDESKVVELADGRLMVNSRVNGNYDARHVHISSDGGQTWTGYKDTQLVDPSCNAAIIRYTYADDGYTKNRLLFSNANSDSARENLTLRISYDEGVTWSAGKVMDPGASAYSDLTICQDGGIGILYEPGYSEVRYLGTTLGYLTDGADSLSKPYQLPGVYPPQDLTGLRAGAPVSIIPFPRDLDWLSENGNASSVAIVRPEGASVMLDHAETLITNALTNIGGVVTSSGGETCTITLVHGPVPNPNGSDEAYSLEVTANSVTITSPTDGGLFYGIQTLEQLLMDQGGSPVIAGCSITDWPAFGIRGFMHDVGRNFQSIDLLKTQIDAFARYKLNTFHWHLTEHAAWRIQSTLYPQLTDAAHHWPTREPGQFYTKAEIADLVNYCAARNITVIPEIDIPGHSQAFRSAIGVTMSDQLAVDVLDDLVNELCDLLPANVVPRIHLGTDEVRGADETPHPDLISTLVTTARNRNREVLTWWHGLDPVDDNVINQLWASYAPRANNPYIDSRSNYINHLDAFDGPIRGYFQQVCRTPKETDKALGGILCYWPDVNIDDAFHGLGIAPVFPSMVAFSERVWRGADRDYPEYWAKLPPAGDPLLEEYSEFEEDLLVHRDKYFAGVLPFPYVRQTQVPWKLIGPFDHGGNLAQSFGPETEILPSYESGGQNFSWTDAVGGTIHLDHFFGFDSYSTASEGTYYALTYVVSETERDVDMWFQFGTPSVSRRRNGGNAPLGKWNAYEAEVWVNGAAIAPPTWNNPGLLSGSGDEIPFTNEGYFYRTPTRVHLNAGTNMILMRVPQGANNGYPAGKWMFSCMPISWDGTQARELEGITFHTDIPSLPDTNIEKDSASLNTRFEGNEIYDGANYINGWTEQNASAVSESLTGTDLNRTHINGAESWIGGTDLSKDGGVTTWASGNSGDWTVETRIKFNECSNGFTFWFGTGTHRIIIEAYADRTQDNGGGSFVSYHNNEDGNFHVYRIAHVSSNSRYHVWRDGERLTPLGGALYDAEADDNRLIFGDYSGSSFGDGANVDIDYVSYDLTGDYLPTGADADGDGMTDTWEYQHFGDVTAGVASADGDGDGDSNLREFIADTDPGNPASRFRADLPVAIDPNTWSISVHDTSPNRNYTLYSTEDITLPNTWTAVPGQGPIPGNGGEMIFTEGGVFDSRFFRVEVEIP